jgi:hypothetical protein
MTNTKSVADARRNYRWENSTGIRGPRWAGCSKCCLKIAHDRRKQRGATASERALQRVKDLLIEHAPALVANGMLTSERIARYPEELRNTLFFAIVEKCSSRPVFRRAIFDPRYWACLSARFCSEASGGGC